MAGADLGTLTARLKLNTADAEASVGRLSATLGGALKAAIGLAGAYLGFQAVKSGIEDATKAFGDQQVATNLLNLALKDTGQKWTPALSKSFASASATLQGYGNDTTTVEGALQKLILRGVPAGKAISDLGQIANFAATAHLSLSDATDVLDKAVSGRLSPTLKELGATTLPKGVTGVTALDRILGQIAPHTAGAAQALNATLPGALSTLGATITDKVMVPLGAFINKGLQLLIPLITIASNWIGNNLTPALNSLGGFITTNVIPPISALWGWFSKNILPIITSVANWFTQHFVPALGGLAQSLNQNVFPALKPVVGLFGTATTGFLWAVTKVGEFIADTLVGAIKTLSDNFGSLKAPLAVVVGSFLTFKAVAVGGEIVQLVSFLASGGLQAGLYGFAAASSAAFAPWLAAAAPVTAIVGAIESMQGVHPGKSSIGNPFGLTVPGQPNSQTKITGNSGVGGFIGWLQQQAHKFGFSASGGPIPANVPRWVGEQGMELFVPNSSGTVIPNNQLANMGHTINVYVTNPVPSTADIGRAVSWALKTASV